MVSPLRKKAMLSPANQQNWVYGHQMAFRPKNLIRVGVPIEVGTSPDIPTKM